MQGVPLSSNIGSPPTALKNAEKDDLGVGIGFYDIDILILRVSAGF
jgi:hypothetical protein